MRDTRGVKRPGPVLVYTTSRLLVLVVALTVLGFLGLRGIALLLVAVVVSGLASYVLLSKQRDAMSAAVVSRAERTRLRMKEATESEDAADDAARGIGSAQGEADAEEHGVDELRPPGVAQDGDEVATDGSSDDASHRDQAER